MSGRTVALGIVAGMLSCGAPCVRADQRPAWQVETRDTLTGAVNPLGLQNALERTWRRPLYASKSPLLADAHVSFGVADRLTPAYDRLGAWVEVAPLSILVVRAGVEPVAYFGTFKSLLSFDDYDARFDDDARRDRAAQAAFALAGRIYAAPALKLKVGRVLARTRAEFEWWRASTDGPYFYEPTRDTLLKARGDAMMTSESVLLYEISSSPGRKLLAGVVHDLTRVYAAPQNRKQDVGILGIVGLGRRALGMREPKAYVKVFRYIEDPYKKDEMGAELAVSFDIGGTR